MIDPCNPLARGPEPRATSLAPTPSSGLPPITIRNPLFRRPTAPAPTAGGTGRRPTTGGKTPRKGPHPVTGGKGPRKAPMAS
jgi:hypothetical protein